MKPLARLPLLLVVLLGAAVGSAVDAFLNLGDTFFGEISTRADVDVLRFDAVAGTRATIEVEADEPDDDDDDSHHDDDDDGGHDDDDDGGHDDDDDGHGLSSGGTPSTLHPRVQVIDLTTSTVLADVSSTNEKVKIKKLELPSTGSYEIRISSADGSTGAYVCETDRKLGDSVLEIKSIDTVRGGDTICFEFDALTGFEIEQAKFKALSPALVDNPELFAPSGAAISLTGFVDIEDDFSELEIEDLLLPEMGTYRLCIQNVGATGKIKTKIELEEDDVDEQDIFESDDP